MVKVKPERTQGKQINVLIFLMRGQQTLISEQKYNLWSKDVIEYQDIKYQCDNFLRNHNINFETIIYTTDLKNLGQKIIVYPNFQIKVDQLFQKMQGSLLLIIRGVIEQVKFEFSTEIAALRSEIIDLKQKIDDMQKAQKDFPLSPLNHLPSFHSRNERKSENIELDIGILFSQPLYNERRQRPTQTAVDFRSEISRLNFALQNSYKASIVMRSEIGTFQSLKSMIKLSKPKILHIVCHGSSDGCLQFEDDSRSKLGLLKYLKPEELTNLKNQLINLPSLVFINSCYSQIIGKAFKELGVQHVVCVNSTDPIADQAAMDFSQSFYRNIFKGQNVYQSFRQKQHLLERGSCCCNHVNHKPGCRWMELTKIYTSYQLHRDYHVPSAACTCPQKYQNTHKLQCAWARKVLFQINKDYRYQDEYKQIRFPQFMTEFPPYFDRVNKTLIICCCIEKDKVPHSQLSKFKLLSQKPSDVIFKIYDRPTPQINDLTQASLLQAHEKSKIIYGRQLQLYQLLKMVRQFTFISIYGKSGVGLTTFSLKASTYMMERREFYYFFFIDLYDIKDQTVFRYKLNETTGEYIKTACTKDKTLFLFDNCDDFIKSNPEQFYKQMKKLQKLIQSSKILITFKQETLHNFDEKKLTLCKKYQLQMFDPRVATTFLYNKMKDKTDISVNVTDCRSLVSKYQVLKIPKVVLSLSQSFQSTSKVTKKQIEDKVQGIKISDTMKLTDSVLNQLRQRSQQAYQFLIFVSQFTDGISFQDINMFINTHFREDTPIKLPIKSNWQQHYQLLFQPSNNEKKSKQQKIGKQQQKNIMKQDEQQIIDRKMLSPPLSTHFSQPQIGTPVHRNIRPLSRQNHKKESTRESKSELDYLDSINSESYFVDKSGKGRFIVKRFIRDFVWKKHKNQVTNYMKFLYVAYFSVILEMLFTLLKKMNYVHEDLTTFSAISSSGMFRFSTSLSENFDIQPIDLTQSQRFRDLVKKQLDTIFVVNEQLQSKMKNTDPSTFILNHKHDFLKFYDNDWEEVYDYLQKQRNEVKQIFIIMLENLMIYIPTALKIANAQVQLIKYVITGSQKQLKRLQKHSKPARNLILQMKLHAISIGLNLQNYSKILQLNSQRRMLLLQFHRLNKIDQEQYADIETMYQQQNFTLDLLKDLATLKIESEDLRHLSNKVDQFLKTIDIKDDNYVFDPLIKAKQGLIITLIFLKFLSNKTEKAKIIKMSTQCMLLLQDILSIMEITKITFQDEKFHKLELKTKLSYVQLKIHCNQLKPKFEQSNLYQDILQCQKIYLNNDYKLKVFTEFDEKIKDLKHRIKQKMWKSASKRIIFMKAFPLSAHDYPIIKNLIRRKNNFRQEIQKILTQTIIKNREDHSSQRRKDKSPLPKSKEHNNNDQKRVSYDISTKYEILTKEKIIQEAKANCSIMFITVDVRAMNNKIYFICENQYLQEELVEINKDLVKELNIQNVLILVLSGSNTHKAMIKITQLCPNPPIIISLHSDDQYDYTHDLNTEWIIKLISRQNQIKQAQLHYTKYFIKKITQSKIQSNLQIKKIHQEATHMMQRQTKCKKVKGFISIDKCKHNIKIQFKEGLCRDLSPGYERNHNIDHKTSQNIILIRRWRKMIQLFKSIQTIKLPSNIQQNYLLNNYRKKSMILSEKKSSSESKEIEIVPSYINVCGEVGCGKTYFIKEIAKILVQRQFYDFGVYLFEGKKIEKNFSGDFEAYINKQSASSRMPNLQNFKTILGHNTILIVDDFHVIKPRVNARMKIFMQQILQKKVNLILVSINQLKQQFLPKMKRIKIEPLDNFQTDVLALNILNVNDLIEIREYNKLKDHLKQNRCPTFKQILDVKDKSKIIKRQYNQETGLQSLQSDSVPFYKRNTAI